MKFTILLFLLVPPQEDNFPTEPIVNFRYEVVETSRKGPRELLAIIRGKEARPAGEGKFRITEPVAEYYTEKKKDAPSQKLSIQARTGLYDTKSEVLSLASGARVIAEDGSRLELEAVELDLKNRRFTTEGPFKLSKNGATIRGRGLDADELYKVIKSAGDSVLTFRGDPRAVLKETPTSQSIRSSLRCDGPMVVIEMMETREGKYSRVVASDNVRLLREHEDGVITTTCDRIEMEARTAGPSDVDLQRAKAEGNVTISQGGTLSIQGDTAVWNRKNDVFVIDGTDGVHTRNEGLTIHSELVELHRATMDLRFRKKVTVKGKFDESSPDLHAESDEFHWFVNDKRGLLLGAPMVEMRQEGSTVHASRVALYAGGLAILQGEKRIRYTTDKVDLTATCRGDALYQPGAGILNLVDRCRVKTQDFTLTSDRMRVLTGGPLLKAFGNVRVTRQKDGLKLFGHVLDCDLKSESMTVLGRPHVITDVGGTESRDGTTWIDLKTQRIRTGKGRMKVHPRSQKK